MGAVVELTDEEWGLVEHLFDPLVHRGVKGTIPRGGTSWTRSCGSRGPVPRLAGGVEPVAALARQRHLGGGDARPRPRGPARHNRKADPTTVMIDARTVKGGRAGPTFHEAAVAADTRAGPSARS
jgi:hypothetical protein